MKKHTDIWNPCWDLNPPPFKRPMPYVLGHSCCFILYLTETIKSQIGLLFFHVHLLFFYYSNLHKNKNPEKKVKKIWNASRICVSSLRRGHANLLCIVPILVYVFRRIHFVGGVHFFICPQDSVRNPNQA